MINDVLALAKSLKIAFLRITSGYSLFAVIMGFLEYVSELCDFESRWHSHRKLKKRKQLQVKTNKCCTKHAFFFQVK